MKKPPVPWLLVSVSRTFEAKSSLPPKKPLFANFRLEERKFLWWATALTMLPHWLEQMSVLLSAPEPT